MWNVFASLIETWEAWSPDQVLNGQRVRAVEQAFREAAFRQNPELRISAEQWELFFGVLLWREVGEAAPLVRTLLRRSKEHRFNPSLALTRFLHSCAPCCGVPRSTASILLWRSPAS
jgi:hypothetical protein